MKLYAIMTLISTLVRQFALPNPFECFGDNAILINWIAEPFIHIIAYAIVGIFYMRGSAPALGSFLYLVAYAGITGILVLMGVFSFAWWWVAIILVVLITVVLGLVYLKEMLS